MTPDDILLKRRHDALGAYAPLFYDKPVRLVRGEGVWVEDADGRRYLDVYNNVPHVGHCHPHVVEAICRQAETLNTHTRYLHETVVAYAERLLATADAPLSSMVFTCTGTESNELALRMARHRSGGHGVIVSTFNYHGNSQLLASLTTAFPVPEAFAPFARAVPIPDPYRDGEGRSDDELAEIFAERVAEAVRSLAGDGVRMSVRCSPTKVCRAWCRVIWLRPFPSSGRPAAFLSPTRCKRDSVVRVSACGATRCKA